MDTSAYTAAILAELSRTLAEVPPEQGEELAEMILRAKRIFAAGAGRSGLAARAFAMRLMHMGLSAYVCGETATPSLQAGDLFLAVSGSGNTATLLCMAEKAKKLGAQLATVTTRPDGAIGRLADLTIRIPAPTRDRPEKDFTSIQPMGSLFEQSCQLFLDAVVLRLMEKQGSSADEMSGRHANLE